jgi:hypothetical protein
MWGWHWGWGGLGSFIWIVFVAVVVIVPWLFFLLNLRGLLERVSEPNRAMPPEHVWLNFIPVFNLGWFIYTVAKVRDSVRAEYHGRGWAIDGDLGYNVGLAAGILGICTVFFGWIPLIGWGVGVAGLICWVIYWLKTADLKSRLSFGDQSHGAGLGAYPPYYTPPAPGAQWQRPPAGQQPAGSPPRPAGPPPQPAGVSPQPGAGSADAAPKRDKDKQCAICATTVTPDDKFCRGCGLPLP